MLVRFALLVLLCTACARHIPDQVARIGEGPFKPTIPQKPYTIVIDAGHGGKDTGSASQMHGYIEKELALSTAFKVQGYLQELGYKTVMTRKTDSYIPLSTRAEVANELKADLFVSIHYNYCPSHEPHGIEVFTYKDHSERVQKSTTLAQQVSSHIVKYTGVHTRGVKQGNLAVVRETKMPAILVEAGFLSNPHEREKVKSSSHQKAIAWGIAKGIDHYLSNL